MNFRFFFVIASFFVTLLCNAQVQVSTKQLVGTKWEVVKRRIRNKEEKPIQKNTVEFSMDSYCESISMLTRNETKHFDKPYYVSDTELADSVFNRKNVGINLKGKYIIVYNNKTKKATCHTIVSFNDDEMVLYHKAGEYKIDCYVTYKRIK